MAATSLVVNQSSTPTSLPTPISTRTTIGKLFLAANLPLLTAMAHRFPNSSSGNYIKAPDRRLPFGDLSVVRLETLEDYQPPKVKYLTDMIKGRQSIPVTGRSSYTPSLRTPLSNTSSDTPSAQNNDEKDAVASLIHARMSETKTPAEIRRKVYKLCWVDESRTYFDEQQGGIHFIEEAVKNS